MASSRRTSRPTTCASRAKTYGRTRPIPRSSTSGYSRATWSAPARSALAGAAEAARAAPARFEFLDDVQLHLHHGHHHQLRDALHRLDGEGDLAAVPHRHHDLSLVVGIDQADEVAEHDAVLVAQTRARQGYRIAGAHAATLVAQRPAVSVL